MNLYFDTEFTGLRKDTTLVSIGIVAEDGKTFYAEFADYDKSQCNDWIKDNVINNLFLLPFCKVTGSYDILRYKRNGYIVSKPIVFAEREYYFYQKEDENQNMTVWGDKNWIAKYLKTWLLRFENVQFVSDVCHYDMVLMIDIFGGAFDLPNNVSAVCHDINQDIAKHYGISEREAFDKSREDIVAELCNDSIIGEKHNALYDAEVIKAIYKEVAAK